MTVITNDIIKLMKAIADPELAEDWDNSGLQVGCREWPVRKVWVALDPAPMVVSAAVENEVDLLITHHPLIFRPLKGIDFGTPLGGIIQNAAAQRMSIYAAHTNLDSAEGGLNDILSARIGLTDCRVLSESEKKKAFKLVVFVPEGHEEKILRVLGDSGAGRIGRYAACSFRSGGKGRFIPDADANPFAGNIGEVNHVDEIRIETIVLREDLPVVLGNLKAQHPYETMAYDVYPLRMMESRSGLGRVGNLKERITLGMLADRIKKALDIAHVKVAGDPELSVASAAVCSGSGGTLLPDFLASGAQVFITGDVKYHDAVTVESMGRGLIDIGHFESEHIVVEPLAKRLREMAADKGYDITVEACRLEKSPFWHASG